MLTVEALRRVPQLADLPEAEIAWLQSRLEVRALTTGEVFIRFGAPFDQFAMLLDGELEVLDQKGDTTIWIVHAGEIFGTLPYSRMQVSPGTGRATRPSRIATMHKHHFREMGIACPTLVERLVWEMIDRTREITRNEQQRAKLVALGKLAAGLAHELNNPSSAIARDAATLSEVLRELDRASDRVNGHCLTDPARAAAQGLIDALASKPIRLGALERAEREDALSSWMAQHAIPGPNVAADLVDRLPDVSVLDRLIPVIPGEALADVVQRAAVVASARSIVDNLSAAATRVADLVRAVKEYSYMDRVASQPTDVHETLELTVRMFAHRLKRAVDLERQYAPDLPLIEAHPGELSQVWTNLVDNALDAMHDEGHLLLQTSRDGAHICVAIQDSGPGIPEAIQANIFEPFFTTKKVGEGTGLGLDVVYGIIERHHGSIRVESTPGRTRFTVRLPISQEGR